MEQYLFNLDPPGEAPVPTEVRPNIWLLSSEQVPAAALLARRGRPAARHREVPGLRPDPDARASVGQGRRLSAHLGARAARLRRSLEAREPA